MRRSQRLLCLSSSLLLLQPALEAACFNGNVEVFDVSPLFQNHPTTPWDLRIWDTLTGDVNGDGLDDFVWNSTSHPDNFTWVGLSSGDGTFDYSVGPLRHPAPGDWSFREWDVLLGDVNGDGRADVIWNSTNLTDNFTYVALGTTGGGLSFLPGPQEHPVNNWDFREWRPILADTNGDGAQDLVWNSTNLAQNVTSIARSNGDGTFTFCGHPAAFQSGTDWSTAEWDVHAFDVSDDGRDDLVWNTTDQPLNETYVALASSSGCDVNFLPAPLTHPVPTWHVSEWVLVTCDVDGDGRKDLVWNSTVTDDNHVYVGRSTGSSSFVFLPLQTDPAPHDWDLYDFDVLHGDVNGNGWDDLIWTSTSALGNFIRVALSRGDGTFNMDLPPQIHDLGNWSFGEWQPFCFQTSDTADPDGEDLLWNRVNHPQNTTHLSRALTLDCNTNAVPDACDPDGDNDGIPDDCDPGGVTPYCFCAASLAPCGNADASAGCANAGNVGATLTWTGSPSIGADDLLLVVKNMRPSQFGIFFVGPQEITAAPFGDGLRCVGGSIQRFDVQMSDGSGSFSSVPVVGFLTGLPTGAFTILPGDRFHFQAWYRDPGGPCGFNFNVSNALDVEFAL